MGYIQYLISAIFLYNLPILSTFEFRLTNDLLSSAASYNFLLIAFSGHA